MGTLEIPQTIAVQVLLLTFALLALLMSFFLSTMSLSFTFIFASSFNHMNSTSLSFSEFSELLHPY